MMSCQIASLPLSWAKGASFVFQSAALDDADVDADFVHEFTDVWHCAITPMLPVSVDGLARMRSADRDIIAARGGQFAH